MKINIPAQLIAFTDNNKRIQISVGTLEDMQLDYIYLLKEGSVWTHTTDSLLSLNRDNLFITVLKKHEVLRDVQEICDKMWKRMVQPTEYNAIRDMQVKMPFQLLKAVYDYYEDDINHFIECYVKELFLLKEFMLCSN